MRRCDKIEDESMASTIVLKMRPCSSSTSGKFVGSSFFTSRFNGATVE